MPSALFHGPRFLFDLLSQQHQTELLGGRIDQYAPGLCLTARLLLSVRDESLRISLRR